MRKKTTIKNKNTPSRFTRRDKTTVTANGESKGAVATAREADVGEAEVEERERQGEGGRSHVSPSRGRDWGKEGEQPERGTGENADVKVNEVVKNDGGGKRCGTCNNFK